MNKSKYEIVEKGYVEDKVKLLKYVDWKEIEETLLLSKSGKKLVGGALQSRFLKIAKEWQIQIIYKGKPLNIRLTKKRRQKFVFFF